MPGMPFPMTELAAMFKPDFLDETNGKIFSDDFAEWDLLRAVDEHNTRQGKNTPYPIKSHA